MGTVEIKVKHKASRYFLLGILVGVAIVAPLARRSQGGGDSSPLLSDVLTAALYPVQVSFSRVLAGVSNGFQELARSRNLNRQSVELRQRVVELEEENRRLRVYWEENQRLRRMLQLAPHLPKRKVIAEAIGLSPSNWFRTATLNKGYKDGIRVDDVVVEYRGVIGRVIQVTSRSSTVLLLTDRRSGVGAMLTPARTTGVLYGTGGETCRMQYLPKSAPPKVGDKVVTSGLGGVFPKGLTLGRVTQTLIAEHGSSYHAIVQPAVDFSELREVFVLK